jgi:hypothetical protein
LQQIHDADKPINESREEKVLVKRLSGLTTIAVLIFAHVTAAQSNPIGYQALEHYQATSPDEGKIVKLVLAYQKAYNSYDAEAVLAVHLPGAMIKAETKGDWSEHLVTKEAYAGIIADKLATSKLYNFKLIFLTPEKITVQENTAESIVPFILYSISQDYWEKGIFNFEFRKTDSGWFISRNTSKILDLSYNP